MNGAESLVHTLLACGIDTCFTNPGTSEMHFVAALDRVPGMRCILGLQENVVTGAADGYARMAGKPAATLLHCGPGLANGLANLHNARRAGSPIVNIVGDQATFHRPFDAPLTADTEGFARGVSQWVRTATHAATVGADAARCVQAASGGIATLILPSDTCWDEGGAVAARLPAMAPPAVSPDAVAQAARVLRGGEPAMLIMGGRALFAGPLATAQGIADATGARMLAQTSNARIEHGAGRVAIDRVPYLVDQALAALAGLKHIILVEAKPPVGFFAYPGKPSRMYPEDCTVHVLARLEQDGPEALGRLADALGASPAGAIPVNAGASRESAAPARGRPTPEALAQSLVALLPEQAIVIDESVSFGRGIYPACAAAAPHDWVALTGGAIGGGVPMATGAAIGAPGRRVVALQADGSAMYTLQGLWTQARERLDVTTVILSNRKYAILLHEYRNVGANPGRTAMDMMDLSNPDLDWVSLAQGMGVEAARAETMERFADLFAQANARPGPFVIELVV